MTDGKILQNGSRDPDVHRHTKTSNGYYTCVKYLTTTVVFV